MKHHILSASPSTFAAKANKLLETITQSVVLQDASISIAGDITALFSVDSTRANNTPGALVSVEVLQGSVEKVNAKLDELVQENPYVRPLRVLAAVKGSVKPSPKAEPQEGSKPGAQAEAKRSVLAIVGTFQP